MKAIKKKILEKKAALLRQQFGYNNSEPIDLKSLLLRQGIITLFRSLGDDLSGMALKVNQDNEIYRFILINREKSLGHQNFTICHELYHLFIQENFVSKICKTGKFDKRDTEEFNADLFASFFLLPEDGVFSNISDHEISNNHVMLSTILRIENMYGCSRKSLLIRLKDLNLITDDIFETYNSRITFNATQYGYAPYLYKKSPSDSAIGNYGELAHKLYELGKISETKYYNLLELLGFNIEDVELINDEDLD